jgi:hypothetical protein
MFFPAKSIKIARTLSAGRDNVCLLRRFGLCETAQRDAKKEGQKR